MTEELEPQPEVETACPECGGEPTDGSVRKHKLSKLGYWHDDQLFECSECNYRWPHGVPIGSSDALADDLECDNPKCARDYCRVHRVQSLPTRTEESGWNVRVHLKCPNCVYFDTFTRESDPSGRVLIGYPDITGETEGAEPYGYPDEGIEAAPTPPLVVESAPPAREATAAGTGLISQVCPSGCPECTADELSAQIVVTPGEPTDVTVECACGYNEVFAWADVQG